MQQRLHYPFGVCRHGYGDSECRPDLLVLAQEHIENSAVDAVVGSVVGDNANDLTFLTIPIDAALPLLVPRRVPRQVVMDDGIERVLQVDALAQTIRAHQHALLSLPQGADARLAIYWR